MNADVQTVLREIGEEIAHARQQLGKSIEDIAHVTRINPRYLESIEQGHFDFLPRPYVKAFLKTFANTVNLDGEVLVEKWQEAERLTSTEPAEAKVPHKPAQVSARETEPVAAKVMSASQGLGKMISSRYFKETLAGIGLVAALLILMILFAERGKKEMPPAQKLQSGESKTPLQQDKRETKVAEIPFEKVLAENEARVQAASLPPQVATEAEPEPEQEKNKLILIATGNVWVKVILDGVEEKEYVFKSGNRMSWEAKESFFLHIGNAGGVKLALNGKPIGPIGENGEVARVQLNRQGVQSLRISKPPRKTPRNSTDGAASTTVDTTANRNN